MSTARFTFALFVALMWVCAFAADASAAETPEWGTKPSDVTLTVVGINQQGPPRDVPYKCCKGGHKDSAHVHPANSIVDHYFVTLEVTMKWKRRITLRSGVLLQRVWVATGARTDAAGWFTDDADAPTAAEIDAARINIDQNGKPYTQLPGPGKNAAHDLFKLETRFGTTNPLCATAGDYHYTQWPAEVESTPVGAVRRTENFEVKDKQAWAIFELDRAYERNPAHPTIRFKTWVKVEEWLAVSPPGCGGKGYSEEHLLDALFAHDDSKEDVTVKGVSISVSSSINIEATDEVNAWKKDAQGKQVELKYCAAAVCGH